MRKLSVLLSCVAVGTMGMTALAQDSKQGGQPPAGERPPRGDGQGGGGGGMRGPQLSPEKAKAAWTAEATGVAKHAGLNESQTKALVSAYSAARESQQKASEKMRQEMRDAAQNSGDRPDFQAMQEKVQTLNKAEKEKFEKALGSTLSADQKTKVLASLGGFNPTWDRWVDSLSELKLDDAKNQEGLNAIEAYVIATEKLRGGDREAMRDGMQKARETLTDSMKKILTDEQFQKLEAAMRPAGQRGGQDGGQRPPRRRRDGNDGGDGGGK